MALFQLDTDSSKVMLSLLNIVLLVVPLVCVVFTTIHFYNSYEFIELMLAQPINRIVVFMGEYLAVSSSLTIGFLLGVGLPLMIYGGGSAAIVLIITGTLLTLVFVSLAFLTSVLTRDKAKAIGCALMLWIYFSLIYDGFLLWIVYSFSDYPLEKVTLALIALNPVDLARIILLLEMDISALMGYTGAFFQEFFGSSLGLIFSSTSLFVWISLPLFFAMRIFNKKDW
jgi:Cu-processing system permease protein